jgi:hypothetical protein
MSSHISTISHISTSVLHHKVQNPSRIQGIHHPAISDLNRDHLTSHRLMDQWCWTQDHPKNKGKSAVVLKLQLVQ